MSSHSLSELAKAVRKQKESDDAFLARWTAPKPQYTPEERLGLIEQRAGDLIKAHPDRDPAVLNAGLDEIREWREVPMNYPVLEDLERLGKGRIKRLSPESEYDIGKGVSTLGRAVTQIPEEVFSSVLSAIRGGDIDIEQDWSDRIIEAQRKESGQFVKEHGSKKKVFPETFLTPKGVTVEDVARLPQNIGNTITSALAGLGVGMSTSVITTPATTPLGGAAAGWAAGTAASGAVAYRMAKDQIVSDLYGMLNQQANEHKGRNLTEKEWDAIREKYDGQASEYGLWEAIPEAMGQALSLGIIRLPVGKFLKLPGIRNRLSKTLASATAKFAAMQSEEQVTETITGYGQSGIEAEMGLREKPLSLAEAAKEQAAQTFLLTSVMGGAGAIGSKVYDKATAKRMPVDQGMAAGTGEVDVVARIEGEVKTETAPEKGQAPQEDTPMGGAVEEVDKVARPKESKESVPPQNLDSFLEVEPEVPLPKYEKPQSSPSVPTPASSAPVEEAEIPAEKPVSPADRMGAESSPIPGRVMTVPTKSLSLDPDRFQYKRGMGRGGAGAKLRKLKKYDPELGGILAVWTDPADGRTYVVNGHHRFELAQRTGHPDVAVRMIKAKTAEAARNKGALINIAEGQGSPEDAATIFRNAGITPESLEETYHVSLKGAVAREGMALSRLEMGIFKRVESGDLPRNWGVVIGENLPDPESQRELVKYLDKERNAGKQVGVDTLDQLILELKGMPRKEEEQMDLFGAEAFSRPLLRERAEIRAYVVKRLAEDRRLFGAVANARKAERLEAEGNVLDIEKNLDIAEKSAILKEAFEKLAAYGGPVSDMLNQAAGDYANAGGKERNYVKQEFFNRIRKEIPVFIRRGIGIVSERTPGYSGAGPSGLGAVAIGEPGTEPFGLTSGASQLHLFAGPEGRQGNLFQDVKEKVKFQKPPGKGAATLGSLRARQRTRMVDTGGSIKAASLHVDDIHAAASLLRRIRRQKQENLYAVTTDEEGKILEIHRVAKGTINASPAPMVATIGRAFNIPNARTVYLAHNHPSGETRPSEQDAQFTAEVRAAGALKDIDVRSLVLGEKGWREILPESGSGIQQPIFRTPGLRTVPVKEGIVVRSKSWEARKQVFNSRSAKQLLREDYGNVDGLLLMDQKNSDIAFMPWPEGKSAKTAAADIIAALEATNTNGILINSSSQEVRGGSRQGFVEDLTRALSGSASVLDVIDRGESWADRGDLVGLKSVGAQDHVAAIRRLNNAQILRSLGESKPSEAGQGMYLEAVRRQVRELAIGFPGFRGRLVVLSSVKNLGGRNLSRAGIDPENELVRGLHVTDATGNRYVYLFADALETPRAVADTLMEEMFHDGISTALGEDSGKILDAIYTAHEADVRDAVRMYDLDLNTPAGRREATDEWLAKGMVHDTLPARVWQKIVAAVNATFRKAGIAVQYSVSEIKALARKAVERSVATSNDAALRKAKAWLKKGVSPRKVWQETGWIRNKDGWTFKPGDRIRKSKAPQPKGVATLTGDREGKLAAKRTFLRHFKEFWRPLSTIPESDRFLNARYKAMGTAAKALRYIEKIHKKLDAFTLDVKKDFFRFMDGQIDENTLPVEARTLAKILKEKTTIIGQMLVDRGIISQETFDAHKGKYVHYMYAVHVLGDKVSGIVTSTGKLNLSYAMRRKDFTADERMALGLIQDASIAVPVGMGKAMIDISKFDFLEDIARNDKWTWTSSLVEVPRFQQREGKPETVKMGIGKLVEEVDKYRELVEKAPNDEVRRRYEILQDILDKAIKETRNVPAEFTQLPTSKTYGPLAGAFVRTPIAKDIMPIMEMHSDQGKLFEALVRFETEGMALFKMGKVALNLPTAARNVISNVIQNNMRGRPLALIPFDWYKACKSMLAKDQYYEEAFGNGIFKTNWSTTEINDVLDEFRKAEGGWYHKVLSAVRKVARLYGKIDDINKHAIYLQMRRDGHPVDKSVLEAMKWGMDYSLASRSVKHLRRHLVPFLSYNYKIAPLIAESLRKRPWVIAKYAVLLPLLAKAIAKERYDMDDEDWEELEKQLPEYVKKSGSTMILPWKTPEGHWQWLNAEYFFPWGNYHNLFNDVSDGDTGEIYKSLGISNPFLDIARMVASARGDQPPQHPFYGTPIYNQLDPAPVKAAKTVEFLAFTWLPSMLSSRGALGYSVKAAEGEKDRWGKKVTPWQAFFRWFGLNVVAVSPSQTRAVAAVKAQDLRKELYRIKNDPSVSEERKEAAERRYRERLAEIARSGAQGAVLPIKKRKGEDPVYDELIRMLEKGASLPGPPARTFYMGGIMRKMSNDQYEVYLERSSSLAWPRLERLMTSVAWRRASEKWRSDRVRKIISGARKRARSGIRRRMIANRPFHRVH